MRLECSPLQRVVEHRRSRGRVLRWLAVVALVATVRPWSAAAPAGDGGYRIGPRDLVSIQVFEVPELNVERRVSDGGSLELPLIGAVEAAGLTERELADRLRELLESRFVQHASVTVQIKEFRSKPISIIGAVRTPGPLSLSGNFTLMEALAAAGGLTENHGDVVHVVRQHADGTAEEVSIDLEALLQRGDVEANIPIHSGDLINVPATSEVTVSCLGEVVRGGVLVFKSTERITLLAAIARAGGLTDRASKKMVIRRRTADGEEFSLPVHYKRIVAGKDPDIELRQDDIILVRQSFF